jgi:Flp pilus assembly protein TadG
MKIFNVFHKRNKHASRAQAMVEFAIALPVLLMLLIGLMEVGRLLLMYAMVSNASRDAVRYASAWGLNDAGTTQKYKDCTGIINQAIKSGYFMNLTSADISISYDTGPSTTSLGTCSGGGANAVESGDRVTVTVSKSYSPLVKLLPISSRTISATSSRTIIGIFELD